MEGFNYQQPGVETPGLIIINRRCSRIVRGQSMVKTELVPIYYGRGQRAYEAAAVGLIDPGASMKPHYRGVLHLSTEMQQNRSEVNLWSGMSLFCSIDGGVSYLYNYYLQQTLICSVNLRLMSAMRWFAQDSDECGSGTSVDTTSLIALGEE